MPWIIQDPFIEYWASATASIFTCAWIEHEFRAFLSIELHVQCQITAREERAIRIRACARIHTRPIQTTICNHFPFIWIISNKIHIHYLSLCVYAPFFCSLFLASAVVDTLFATCNRSNFYLFLIWFRRAIFPPAAPTHTHPYTHTNGFDAIFFSSRRRRVFFSLLESLYSLYLS